MRLQSPNSHRTAKHWCLHSGWYELLGASKLVQPSTVCVLMAYIERCLVLGPFECFGAGHSFVSTLLAAGRVVPFDTMGLVTADA